MSNRREKRLRRQLKNEIQKNQNQEMESSSAPGEVRVAQIQKTSSTVWSPLPPPEMLANYATVHNELVPYVLDAARRQSIHRQEMDRRIVSSHVWGERLSIVAGWSVAIAGLFVAYKLGMAGHEAPAATVGGAGLAAIAGAFLVGRSRPKPGGHE